MVYESYSLTVKCRFFATVDGMTNAASYIFVTHMCSLFKCIKLDFCAHEQAAYLQNMLSIYVWVSLVHLNWISQG